MSMAGVARLPVPVGQGVAVSIGTDTLCIIMIVY